MSNQTSGSDSQSISTSSAKDSEAEEYMERLRRGNRIKDMEAKVKGEGIPIGHHLYSAKKPDHDPVNHPRHYNAHPSGVECIEITEHMNFNLGNAVKYIWRADNKNGIEDLEKAAWYVNREIERRSR